MPDPSTVDGLPTPTLVVERSVFEANLTTMTRARPGAKLRPHVKAFKSTEIARRLGLAGHHRFCAATVREIEGLVRAGLGYDLLLANEVLDYHRLTPLVERGARITVAVDSEETIRAAAGARIVEVLIDVEVGLPRCGCDPGEAGRLADVARSSGLEVRGVMGYEGHLMMVADRDQRQRRVERAMKLLADAHDDVGGEIVSAGGTGTYEVNTWATEIQAGSYLLMDHHYATLEVPFEPALTVAATVISVSPKGWYVVDAGLKAFGMDHGNPVHDTDEVRFCSDEHTTMAPGEDRPMPAVGDRVRLVPGHVDPTVAKHQYYWVADGNKVIDRWSIDLRHW